MKKEIPDGITQLNRVAWGNMAHVVIDLESFSTSTRCAIVAIGAVACDADFNLTGYFYAPVSLDSNLCLGRVVDASTLLWWQRQPAEAWSALDLDRGLSIGAACLELTAWMQKTADIQVWGNGPEFDNAALEDAFRSIGLRLPWSFWNNQSARTIRFLKAQLGIETERPEPFVKHHALYDAYAEYQEIRDTVLKLKELVA